jgi:hypothetical protein
MKLLSPSSRRQTRVRVSRRRGGHILLAASLTDAVRLLLRSLQSTAIRMIHYVLCSLDEGGNALARW